jgi:hypothetical protein
MGMAWYAMNRNVTSTHFSCHKNALEKGFQLNYTITPSLMGPTVRSVLQKNIVFIRLISNSCTGTHKRVSRL